MGEPYVMIDRDASQLDMILAWYANHWFLGLILLLTLSWAFVMPFRFLYLAYQARQFRLAVKETGWPENFVVEDSPLGRGDVS